MIPQSTAWRIAQSNEGLGLLPYADRARLTGIYDLQDFYYEMEQQFTDQLTPTTLSPDGNFYLVLLSCESRLEDLTVAEDELARSYSRETASLRSAFRLQ